MPSGVYIRTEQAKRNISLSKQGSTPWNKGLRGYMAGEKHPMYGKHHSEESKRQNALKHMGKIPWNKGKIGIYSQETLKKISLALRGRKHTEESKEHMSKHNPRYWLGKSRPSPSVETRKKMSESHKKGAEHRNWKGGITPRNEQIRKSLEYKLWRDAISKRDNFTCLWCKQHGGALQADHIKPFALYPELRFAINNGRTLCKSCHLKTDTWGGKGMKKIRIIQKI